MMSRPAAMIEAGDQRGLTDVGWTIVSVPEYRALAALVLIFAIFTSLSRQFIGPYILPGILVMGSELAILAMGMTFVMMCGEIDLSIASVYGWGALWATLLANAGLSFPLSVLLAIAFGAFVGFLNGVITLRFRIPALITTMASMWILRGLMMGLFGGTFFSYRGAPSLLLRSLGTQIGVIPGIFLWFLGIAVILWFVLARTKLGNHILATGGNARTARALGVNVFRTKVVCFMLSTAIAAFAGTAYLGRTSWFLSRLGMSSMGFGLEIEAIAISVMGGTSFRGGQGSLVAVCLAAFAFASFKTGLILAGVSSYWVDGVASLLLIGFCVLQGCLQRK
jgi:simple sugar transport system permease protein